MNGLVMVEPTDRVFTHEGSCIEYGHHFVLEGTWSTYRCVWEAAGGGRWRLYGAEA